MCDLPVHGRCRLFRGRGRQQVHREEQCWLQVFKHCVCGVLWAVPGIRLCRGDRRHAIPATFAEPVADPHTARWPGGCALLQWWTQRGGHPRDGVGDAAWLRRLPVDDGAAMEAEVANVTSSWHQHAGVRQSTEMARTLRWRRKELTSYPFQLYCNVV